MNVFNAYKCYGFNNKPNTKEVQKSYFIRWINVFFFKKTDTSNLPLSHMKIVYFGCKLQFHEKIYNNIDFKFLSRVNLMRS